MVAERGLTNQANVHTPMWEKSFKIQHGRIPIDPAIMAGNWTSFHSPSKNARGDQKPETFFVLMKPFEWKQQNLEIASNKMNKNMCDTSLNIICILWSSSRGWTVDLYPSNVRWGWCKTKQRWCHRRGNKWSSTGGHVRGVCPTTVEISQEEEEEVEEEEEEVPLPANTCLDGN